MRDNWRQLDSALGLIQAAGVKGCAKRDDAAYYRLKILSTIASFPSKVQSQIVSKWAAAPGVALMQPTKAGKISLWARRAPHPAEKDHHAAN